MTWGDTKDTVCFQQLCYISFLLLYILNTLIYYIKLHLQLRHSPSNLFTTDIIFKLNQ